MKLCILIHISRKTISFSYNSEGSENKFIACDSDEFVKPLAIYSRGKILSIGYFALNEYNKDHSMESCAYYDIFDFDKMAKIAYFNYNDEKIDINKLLFFAIEKYLSDFLEKTLFKQAGSLEDNRASLALVFIFAPDLNETERNFVIKSFKDSGYGNCCGLDIQSCFIKTLENKESNLKGKSILSIYNNGENLICRLYFDGNSSESITIKGVGKDPRIDKAIELVFQDIVYQGYDRETIGIKEDKEKIRKKVITFLRGSKPIVKGSLSLSDGEDYSFSLNKNDFNNNINNADETKVTSELNDLLSENNTKASECTVILTSLNPSNDVLENILCINGFMSVIKVTEKERIEALNSILAEIKKKDYLLSGISVDESSDLSKKAQSLFADGKFKEAKGQYKILQGDFSEEIKLCNQCIREERELNITNVNVDEAKDILIRWSDCGISNIIIEPYREKIEAILKKGNEVGVKISTSIQNNLNRIDDIIHSEIDNEARKLFVLGKFKEARDKYHNLKGDFGKEIADCNKCIRNLKELNVANDSTIQLILDEWKKLGITQTFIDKYIRKESSSQSVNRHVELKSVNQKEARLNIADARQLIMKGKKQGLTLLDNTEKKLHATNFHVLDDKINEIRGLWHQDQLKTEVKPKAIVKSTTVSEESKVKKCTEKRSIPIKQQNIVSISEREIRVRKAEALAQIRTGELEKGRKNLLDLMSILKYMNFHKYDKELTDALTKTEK